MLFYKFIAKAKTKLCLLATYLKEPLLLDYILVSDDVEFSLKHSTFIIVLGVQLASKLHIKIVRLGWLSFYDYSNLFKGLDVNSCTLFIQKSC